MRKEGSDNMCCLRLKTTVLQSIFHKFDPSVARGLIDRERRMPQSELRMTSMVQIILRSPEAKNQKHAQPIFGPLKVIGRIHRPQQIVLRHLLIERSNQATDAVRTDRTMDLVFGQNATIG